MEYHAAMSYPAPSNFAATPTAADPAPAWWRNAGPAGGTRVCATYGAAVVWRARAALGLSEPTGSEGPRWDREFATALTDRAAAAAVDAPGRGYDALAELLAADRVARRVSRAGLAFAIYVAFPEAAGVELPGGTVLPPWDQPMPRVNGAGDPACQALATPPVVVYVQPPPAAPPVVETLPAPAAATAPWVLATGVLGTALLLTYVLRENRV